MRTTEAAVSSAAASPQVNRPGQGRQEKSGQNFSALLEGMFSSSIGKASFIQGTETDNSGDDCMTPGFSLSMGEDEEDVEDVRHSEGEQALMGITNALIFSFHPQEQTLRGFEQNSIQEFIPPGIPGKWDELAPQEKELVQFLLASMADDDDDSMQTEKTIKDHVILEKQHLNLQNSLEGQDISQNRENNALTKPDLSLHNNQGALNPKAGAFIASMLREGKSLQELPQEILQELGNYISGKIASDEGLSRESSLKTILSRLEEFLHVCLGAEREEGQKSFTGLNGNPLLSPELGDGQFTLNSNFQDQGGVRTQFMSSYGQAREYAGLHPKEILSQIVDRMDFLARPGEQEMRLKLEPEFLGQVLIRVRIMNEKLTGEIITSHIAVKELLEGQLETLRQRFQEMDLNIEDFNISVRDEAHDGSPFERDSQPENVPWGDGSEGHKEGERVLASSTSLWGGGRMVDYFV